MNKAQQNDFHNYNRNLVYGTSRATRGAYYEYLKEARVQKQLSQREAIVLALKQTSIFEKIWYPLFIIPAIACLFLIKPLTFNLCFAVASLLFYMIANNLVAKGKTLGIIIGILSSILYVVVSFFAKVYGEVIINVFLYIPLDIYALITFKKNTNKKTNELEVKRLSVRGWFMFIGLFIIMLSVVYAILTFIPGQIYPMLNALPIVLFLLGTFIRNSRYKEFWWFNLLGNLTTIILWILVATSSKELLFSLPFTLSSMAAFFNNIYGLFLWRKLYRNSIVKGKIYVKTNKVKVKNIIKVRQRYLKSLKWNREVEENKQKNISNQKKEV